MTKRALAWMIMLALTLGACTGGGAKRKATKSPAKTAAPVGSQESSAAATAPQAVGASIPPGRTVVRGGTKVTVPPGGGPPIAELFPLDRDRIGITDKKITICTHAALIFGDVFQTTREDLDVYWMKLNDGGGIYGRKVESFYEDDAYQPGQAVIAAQACMQRNPFILIGGFGFDQVPAVRNWAEQNKMLYLHSFATRAGSEGKQYSFTGMPTIEQVGTLFGDWIVRHYRSKKVGIVWRQSENWKGGHDAGVQVLKDRGVNIVADLPVTQNQSSYSQQIIELQTKGAEVAWLWENALAVIEFIRQARAQAYRPQWLFVPFNLITDTLGPEALDPPVQGIAAWPAYTRGRYDGPFAPYADEMRAFEQAYAKYRPNTTPDDIKWITWLGWKGLHQLLTACGKDCSRNRFAGVMLGGFQMAGPMNCRVDFSRDPHRGGYQGIAYEAFANGAGASLRNASQCEERFP